MALAPNATSTEVEQFFIAAVLATGNAGRAKVRFVEAAHFADKRHQIIWKAILKIESVGWLLLKEHLKDSATEEILAHAAKIAALKPEDPILALAKRLTDLAAFRALSEAAAEIVRLSMPQGADAGDAYLAAIMTLRKARPVTMQQDLHHQDEMVKMLDETVAAERQGAVLRSYPMPFKGLYQFGGMCIRVPRKKLVVVAGDWGTGKSTFLRDIMDWGIQNGFNCLLYSPEWSEAELAAMTLQKFGGPSIEKFNNHTAYWNDIRANEPPLPYTAPYSKQDKEEHKFARDVMLKRKGHLSHISRRMTIEQLEDRILETRAYLAKQGKTLDAIFVDYITKLKTERRFNSEHDRNNFITEELVALAERYDLAVFAVSQVNKAGGREAKKEGRPVDTHDLHGARGDDPKLIITITPEYNPQGEKNGWATIFVGKQNLGRTGMKRMRLNTKLQTWEDEDAADDDPAPVAAPAVAVAPPDDNMEF